MWHCWKLPKTQGHIISHSFFIMRRILYGTTVISYCLSSITRFASASPTTIKSDALKNIDGVPSLGRGYSITTNSFYSTCFDINGITAEYSYNFDCKSKNNKSILFFKKTSLSLSFEQNVNAKRYYSYFVQQSLRD